jgi:hypothetical protein
MSAPHVAGLAALFKQLHPTWSPMAIKSALMTTGTDVLDNFVGTAASDAAALRNFAQGAGHVRPNAAMNPGLVYDSDWRDWFAFLCGTTSAVNPATCSALVAAGYSTARTDVNVPSIALNNVAGPRSVTRKVTNVTGSTQTFTAAGSVPGMTVTATPSELTLAPGETKSFQVTVTNVSATLNRWTGGHFTWSNGSYTVRIPVVARPVLFGSPTEVFSDGSPVSWTVGVGYAGELTASVGGLVPATTTPFTVDQDPDQTFNPNDPTGTFRHDVVGVPANTVFRAGIYEDAITPNDTDLDMFVYRCAPGCAFVGQSADGDSNEEVTHFNTATATYIVFVHGWSTGSQPQASGTLFTWQVGATDEGNTELTGVESPASIGTQTHTATFSGLDPDTRYLGRVDYGDGTNTIGRTLLNVRTP